MIPPRPASAILPSPPPSRVSSAWSRHPVAFATLLALASGCGIVVLLLATGWGDLPAFALTGLPFALGGWAWWRHRGGV